MNLLWKTFSMAARNLGRNKKRTASTLLAIVVGLVGLILLDGYINYSMWGLKETIIHSGSGHFQVAVSSEAFDDGESDPFSFVIPNADRLAKELRRMPQVKSVIPSIDFYAVVNAAGRMETVLVKSLPSRQSEDLTFLTLNEGELLVPDLPGRILVGQGLASKLGVSVNQPLSLFAVTQGGGTGNKDFSAAGIVSSGISASDASTIYMDLADAQELLQSDAVPRLTVFLEHTEDTDSVLEQLRAQPPTHAPKGALYRAWYQLSPYFVQANGSYQMVLTVARLIVLLVALFSISSTISLSVLERLREVGTLRAFGTRRGNVTLMFTVEGLILGVLGCLLGFLVGALMTVLINASGGILMPAQPGMSHPMSILFRPLAENYASNGLWVALVSVTGALVPGYYSSRKVPADLLRAT